jgi:hypothetical protein
MSCKDKRNRSSDAESKEILESVRKYQKIKGKKLYNCLFINKIFTLPLKIGLNVKYFMLLS